ncbi:MAG: PKD domain-containing protein [Saprospiraceae bacterium]|nr:PKD domain-containing protein [Saprospiraceae bacterium]
MVTTLLRTITLLSISYFCFINVVSAQDPSCAPPSNVGNRNQCSLSNPTLALVSTGNNIICEGDEVIIEVDTTQSLAFDYYVYYWCDGTIDTAGAIGRHTYNLSLNEEDACDFGETSFFVQVLGVKDCGEGKFTSRTTGTSQGIKYKPRARFSAPNEKCITDKVQFSNESCFGTTYFWEFGDGTTSEEENPSHLYDRPGVYRVTLTTRNDCDASKITKFVSIVGEPIADFTFFPNDPVSYLDVITYHPYNSNPDNSYEEVFALRDTVQKYSTTITLFQGENGAPSEFRKTKALRGYNWTELSQAKWALRRMLGDWGRGIPSSIFSICDLHYPDEINRKGLLLTNENQQVVRPKHAYYAVQHLASIFDYSLLHIKDYPIQHNTFHGLSLFAYEKENTGQQVVTIWFNDNIPSDYNSPTLVDFTFPNGKFERPVYVDLRTGYIYQIPKSQWHKEATGYTFFDIPVYDSPILIADLSAISLQ